MVVVRATYRGVHSVPKLPALRATFNDGPPRTGLARRGGSGRNHDLMQLKVHKGE